MDGKELLRESYTRMFLIPVVGSGLSVPFHLPDWRTLIEDAAKYFSVSDADMVELRGHLDRFEYVEAADTILAAGVSELDLQRYVADSMRRAKEDAGGVESNYQDLAMLEHLRFITTNYDRYLNDLADAETFRLEELEEIKINEFATSEYDRRVIPLHGEISRPESIVLTGASYKRLYDSPRFREEFQQLRTRFMFLFVGFSFNDRYVQTLFDRALQRFETRHFILLEKNDAAKDREKIEKLRERYGLETLCYDASVDGHTKAISRWLRDTFRLRDNDVDLSGMDKLPEKEELQYAPGEQELADRAKKLIEEDQLTELYELYAPIYHAKNFTARSVKLQTDVICALMWYWGFQRRDGAVEALVEQAFKNPAIAGHENRLLFMYGQHLWNSRQFEKGIAVLRAYDGEPNRLTELLLDLLVLYQRFLPERAVQGGTIPVYGPTPRDEAAQAAYRAAYEELKAKYINPETYNLKMLEAYRDRDAQQIAYYWLGIAAGQLFHEHAEAIQYLLRAYELQPGVAICEELAQNYFAQAETGIRYRENAKKYQIDMGALLKAKIRFQYAMNFSDKTVVKSMYERSGFAFLKTLYYLKDFIAFYEFWNKGSQYIPETDDLLLMKAEADAAYEHTVSGTLLSKLSEKDRRYIEYCCAMHRADFFSRLNPMETLRIRNMILRRAENEPAADDERVARIVLDTALVLGARDYYEHLRGVYPKSCFEDMRRLGLEDELYGRLDAAEAKLRTEFEAHRDYDGTFQILRGFYVRHKMREKYDALIREVTEDPPDEIYRQSGFYTGLVMAEARDWRNAWGALRLYDRYSEKIGEDIFLKKQVEESLKYFAADYTDCEDRVAWNRQQIRKAPYYARMEPYHNILHLYLANGKYREADEIVQEMRRENVPQAEGLDKIIQICLREQRKKFYSGNRRYFSSDSAFLDRLLRGLRADSRYWQPSFAAEGQNVILSMAQLLCVFKESRQTELQKVGTIHIMYAGMIQLQNSIWCGEDVFLRMVLQWLARAKNVRLGAPPFRTLCRRITEGLNMERSLEMVQLELYRDEHPDFITL